MDLDPILSALSKLEQSINDRYTDLNDKYQLVHTQLEEFNNKITNLDEKVESILSIVNNLQTTSPTVNVAAPDTPQKTKRFPFESMLQTWQSYCKEKNMTIIPKAETKLSGWVRNTWKAYKQYINNEPSTLTKEREELLKAANFPFNYPTSTDHPSEKKAQSTPNKIVSGKKSNPTTTKSTAGIADDKIVHGKKSNPTVTKSTGSFPFFKKLDGKKSKPTPTKSSAISSAKATESLNLESKMTETKMSESNDTKLKKSFAVTTAKATESLKNNWNPNVGIECNHIEEQVNCW
jgi:hypothetical protein